MSRPVRSPSAEAGRAAAPAAGVPAVVPAIDGLRGLAAILVLLFHCWVFTDAPLGRGALRGLVASFGRGVDFFFVISGFVLFLPVVLRDGRFGDVRAYLVRRVARIVPAYYVSLVLQSFTVRWLTGFPSPYRNAGGLVVLVAHLLFLQHELPASLARAAGFWGNVVGFGVNGVVWSLSIEAALLPGAAAGRRAVLPPSVGGAGARGRGEPRLAGARAERAGALRRVGGRQRRAAPARSVPRVLRALRLRHVRARCSTCGRVAPAAGACRRRRRRCCEIGLARAARVDHDRARRERRSAAQLRAPGARSDAGAALRDPDDARGDHAGGPLRVFTWPRARWLGDVSYGVFLWHQPLILLVRRYTTLVQDKNDLGFVVMCVLVLPASLLLGWLSRRFVEEPAIRWARRWNAARVAASPALPT